MADLDFIVPGALVSAPLAPDLLRELDLPHLARIARYASERTDLATQADSSLAPWQAYVFGSNARTGFEDADINLAELWAMACGLPQVRGGSGRWLVEPAHFRIAQDHLRLDDPHGLAITLAEAKALSAAIARPLEEAGWRLEPVAPATCSHWFLLRDDAYDLSGAALDRAISDNVARWQPKAIRDPALAASPATALDEPGLAWRRCVNEIQMLWFGHPVNEAREARGQPTINALWLSGNGAAATPLPHYRAIDSTLPLLAALPIEPAATRVLESFDALITPARGQDWASWRASLLALDARLGEILRLQREGKVDTLALALFGIDRGRVLHIASRDLGKFWRAWGTGAALSDVFTEQAVATS